MMEKIVTCWAVVLIVAAAATAQEALERIGIQASQDGAQFVGKMGNDDLSRSLVGVHYFAGWWNALRTCRPVGIHVRGTTLVRRFNCPIASSGAPP